MKKIILATLGATAIALSIQASEVLATVNGKEITKDSVQKVLNAMGAQASYDALPQEVKSGVLNQVIEQYLLEQKAVESGIMNDPEYKKALNEIKRKLALDIWMKKQLDSIKISNEEAKKAYKEHKSAFAKDESVHARHILVDNEEEAKSIIEELNKTPKEKLKEKFKELAKAKSIGPSASSGGDLGTFTKEQMVKEFSDAAFSLKEGEYTKSPVKTQFGYHVIYVEKKVPAKTMPFEEVKDRIKDNLKMEKFKEKIQSQARELRSKADIKIN